MGYYKRGGYQKPQVVKEPRAIRNWSDYQVAVFTDVASGLGNSHIEAKAGSGKTTTLVESLYHIKTGSILYCAFAKSIQTELEKRAPLGVDCFTFHSIGYKACRRAFPKIGKIDDRGEKLYGFIKAERGEDPETQEVRDNLAKAISLCKGYLVSTPEEIDPILDRHEIDICSDTRQDFIATVIKIMTACKNDTSRIDFTDMIWMPHVHGLKVDTYDRVFIDEAQDLNLAQIDLALRSCNSNGRIVSCGDKNQAIYGFAGADSNSIQNIIDRMHSKTLALNVTYRCARNVVELAKTLVPELEAAPNAIDGKVERVAVNIMEQGAKPGDFIISRSNAPLIRQCLSLLKNHIPANIQGRDVGKNLISMIRKSKAETVPTLIGWLEEYKNSEVERLGALKRDPSLVQDKVDCLETLCEGTRDLSEVKDNINKLFNDGDDKSRVILGTTHKLKGLERDTVWMLTDTYKPGKNQEESNLAYVAYTRAKVNLNLVSKVI